MKVILGDKRTAVNSIHTVITIKSQTLSSPNSRQSGRRRPEVCNGAVGMAGWKLTEESGKGRKTHVHLLIKKIQKILKESTKLI